MTGPLRSLDAALAEVLASLVPVAATEVALDVALGHRLTAPLQAPGPVPPAAVALRAGLAVNALDLVGASLHAPVALAHMPVMVAAGDAMPPGCDAVLDPAAVVSIGPLVEAMDSIAPGTWVRRAGHDVSAGAIIATAGMVLTPEVLLAAKLSGVSRVFARRPVISLDWPAGPERDWLGRRLASLGVVASLEGTANPHLILRPATDDHHRIALMPGIAVDLSQHNGITTVAMPRRFDGVVGAWCAVVLPIVANLSGGAQPTKMYRLTRKIASSVGMAEVALMRTTGDDAEPLAVGDLTLAAIAAADAFAVITAGAEGHAAGGVLACTSFAATLASPPGLPS